LIFKKNTPSEARGPASEITQIENEDFNSFDKAQCWQDRYASRRGNKNVRGGHTLTDPALILSRIARLAYYSNSSTSQIKRRWREKWPSDAKGYGGLAPELIFRRKRVTKYDQQQFLS
jgi:hypothetical protein